MMKKITKLMLTLAFVVLGVGGASATKLYATYGTPASSGSWDAETSTYAWTASYSNLMTIFEFPNNDLGDYTSLHLTTSNYVDGPYRVCFMNGGTLVATIAFYSAGQKDLVFSERTETKDIDLSAITHISFGGASGGGSIKLTSTPYLAKSTTVNFDENGIALLGLTDINADANLTYDDTTGEITSTGSGTFTVSLNNEDFSHVTKVELLRSGDDIVSTLQITDADNGVLNTWYGSKYSCNFTSYQTNASKITKLAWNCSNAGTMTITGVRITASVITATDPHYTNLTSSMFHNWTTADADAEQTLDAVYPSYELGNSLAQGATIYGDGNVFYLNYADITDYDKLVVKGTAGTSLRVLLNRLTDGGATTEVNPTFDSNGSLEVDLSTYKTSPGYVHLNAIKRPWDGSTATITSIQLYKADVTSPYDYVFVGSGVLASSATAALADASATYIDATGITAATELSVANPNCLITANAGMVTNTKNVIVDGVCANLVLTDQKPFKAPAAFTAANATFTKTMTDAEYATMMIPFTAAVPEGLVARVITGNDGNVLITEVVDGNVTKDKPVLLKGAAGDYVFTATDAEVAVADGIQDNGLLYGTYDATYNVPENSYVLQKQDDEVKFFKAIDGTTVKAFRAYLDLGHSEGSLEARNFTFDFENEATGLQQAAFAPQRQAVIYNLQGQRIAQPAQGLYIKGGKKVIIK